MNHKNWMFVFAVATSVLVFLLLVMFFETQLPARTIQAAALSAFVKGESFIYLFSPTTSTFVFTFSLPTFNAAPQDVSVVSEAGRQEVWFTEPGANRIGRLTFTSTTEYSFREYWASFLVSDSQPLNLVVDEEFVWFTEAGGNRIGRLDPTTGQVNEFELPTPNSYPADLTLAADGSIWFTEMAVDQIGRLVVNSPSSYTITEYSTLSLNGGQPYSIVAAGGSVYFAQTANDLVTRFTLPDQWVNIKGFAPGSPDEPYNLVVDKMSQIWGTERTGNRISQFKYTTFPIIVPYNLEPAASLPTSLAIDENDHIWFTQWGAGQIGRLIPGSIPQKDYYPLPQLGAAPTGIATDNAGGIWVLALRPYRVYLPLVANRWSSDVPPFGVQFYSALTDSAGLDHAADAGARWIRVPVSWRQIEPNNTTPDNYFWSYVDDSVTNAANRGIELILTLSGQPSWAAIYAMGPVTNTADIQEFMGALVERYDGDGLNDAPGSPQVHYFEVYNEPDNSSAGLARHGGWGYWGHNGAGYAQLLQALYPLAKAASPRAQIVFGGMALDWFEEQGGPFDSHFLDDVLAACQGQACFDVMNFHYYPPFRPNWEAFGPDIIGKTNYVRQKLAGYGFSDLPLVCTETSWVSGGSWGSAELQSRYIAKAYARGSAANLDVVIWYAISDLGDESLPGLLDESFQPKVSYYAFAVMTRMLKDAAYQRALEPAETGSSQLVGYVFDKYGRRLDIVWTEDNTPFDPDDDPHLPLIVNAVRLTITDKFGTTQSVGDMDDGVADGQITVYIGGSPLYLEYNP